MSQKKSIVVSCVDYRHWEEGQWLFPALREQGIIGSAYLVTAVGGGGVLGSFQKFPEIEESTITQIRLCQSLGGSEVIIVMHGIGEDPNGCGGSRVNGFPQEEMTQVQCDDFLEEKLKKAKATLHSRGIDLPIRMIRVTFTTDHSNVPKEIIENEQPVSTVA